jgi:hypothetical protein
MKRRRKLPKASWRKWPDRDLEHESDEAFNRAMDRELEKRPDLMERARFAESFRGTPLFEGMAGVVAEWLMEPLLRGDNHEAALRCMALAKLKEEKE